MIEDPSLDVASTFVDMLTESPSQRREREAREALIRDHTEAIRALVDEVKDQRTRIESLERQIEEQR